MNGAQLIAEERKRQVEIEGFDAKHDERYYRDGTELAQAGATYALLHGTIPRDQATIQFSLWPWHSSTFKPESPLRDLAKAGALIAAAMDRLIALGEKP